MRNKLFFLISFLLLASLLSACASTPIASAQEPDSTPRTLSVTGSGKAYLTPDIAYVTIGVHSESKDASEAVASNNTQAKKVSDALKAFGIDAKDIQTTNFSIYPQQQYDREGKLTGDITYIVDNSVYVTVRDITKVGDLLDASVKAGANSIYGVQFDVADKTEALSEARRSAVADARAVAEELADAADVTLGEVQNLSVYSGGYPAPVYAREYAVQADGGSVPVSPGQTIITVEVSIVYTIY